jgi:hypothetical protein
MGNRDVRHREKKKPKKDTKKSLTSSVITPATSVEVIKRGKKETTTEE